MRYAGWGLAVPVSLAAALAGCNAPPHDGPPVTQALQVQPEGVGGLFEAAAEVLRRDNFRIDRLDRRAGVIKSYPETSQHFVEFWRHDVDTPYDFMEASLRPVRRTATVTISTNGASGEADVTVEVQRETFATPERQFNSSIAAFRMFGDALPAVHTGRKIAPTDEYWIAAGRDLAMERYLLDRIVMVGPSWASKPSEVSPTED